MKYRYYTGMCIKHIMRPSLISENSGKTNTEATSYVKYKLQNKLHGNPRAILFKR